MDYSILITGFSHEQPDVLHPEGESPMTPSLAVFFLLLGASEIIVFLVCKLLSWYSNFQFYTRDSFDWIHWDSADKIETRIDESLEKVIMRFQYQPSDKAFLACPICLVEYETGEEVVNGSCCHIFHEKCLAQWLNIRTSCPYCRETIAPASRGNIKQSNYYLDSQQADFRQVQSRQLLNYSDVSGANFHFFF